MVDQNVPIQDALSGKPGFESSKGKLGSASDPGLSIPDSEDFGIRRALNTKLLKGSANQPVLDGWLSPNLKSDHEILTEPVAADTPVS